jgi:NitT/TauT family transport system permease protein
MKNTQHFITSLRNEAVGFILIIAVWGVASLFYPPYIIPSPLAVFTDFQSFLPEHFGFHLGMTLYRTAVGFGMAYVFGTLLGMLAFTKKWVKPVNSLMMALQVLPGVILGVIFLLMFGLGSTTPILLVAFLTLPTMTINTVNGLSKKDTVLEEYLVSIKSSRMGIARYIYLPALIPVLESNLSLGMSMAVKVVVLGEFIGTQDGLGYLLNNARIFFNMKEVFFYLVVLLLFTLIFQAVQSAVFATFFKKYYFAAE